MGLDSDTLLTASTYLNNLLLARGLLRNNKNIDFAKPARETRAQIINLVHDLLLKRDRDDESREKVADAIRDLRVEQKHKDAEIARLRTRLADKERGLNQAQVEARNAKAEYKRLQTTIKTLQSQLGKLKALSEHVKTQCISDIRKRDLQIERLKTHLQGQQRGNRSLVVAPSISITGGSRSGQNAFDASVHSLQDPEYSLKQETNEFLTQLGQSLSEENDSLINLIHNTLGTMRELLGVQGAPDFSASVRSSAPDAKVAQAIAYERMASELESLLDTLRNLLTNPNFVSLEEVDIRDEEIHRLRDGWEKMEARWQDVLMMMDGWRQRLEKSDNDTINLADLRMGLGLGAGFNEIKAAATSPMRLPRPSMPLMDPIEEDTTEPELVSRDSGISGISNSTTSSKSAPKSVLKNASPVKIDTAPLQPPDFFDLRPPHSVRGHKLQQLNNDFQSPRRVAFREEETKSASTASRASADVEDKSSVRSTDSSMRTSDLENVRETRSSRLPRKRTSSPSAEPSTRASKKPLSATGGSKSVIPTAPATHTRSAVAPAAAAAVAATAEPLSSSFLEHAPVPTPARSALSVAEKLRAAQLEAEAERAQPAGSPALKANQDEGDDDELLELLGLDQSHPTHKEMTGSGIVSRGEGVEEVPARAARSSPARKAGVRGRPSRRRKSTLSPEELEGLLNFD